jgi:hypothetical protein
VKQNSVMKVIISKRKMKTSIEAAAKYQA